MVFPHKSFSPQIIVSNDIINIALVIEHGLTCLVNVYCFSQSSGSILDNYAISESKLRVKTKK